MYLYNCLVLCLTGTFALNFGIIAMKPTTESEEVKRVKNPLSLCWIRWEPDATCEQEARKFRIFLFKEIFVITLSPLDFKYSNDRLLQWMTALTFVYQFVRGFGIYREMLYFPVMAPHNADVKWCRNWTKLEKWRQVSMNDFGHQDSSRKSANTTIFYHKYHRCVSI